MSRQGRVGKISMLLVKLLVHQALENGMEGHGYTAPAWDIYSLTSDNAAMTAKISSVKIKPVFAKPHEAGLGRKWNTSKRSLCLQSSFVSLKIFFWCATTILTVKDNFGVSCILRWRNI